MNHDHIEIPLIQIVIATGALAFAGMLLLSNIVSAQTSGGITPSTNIATSTLNMPRNATDIATSTTIATSTEDMTVEMLREEVSRLRAIIARLEEQMTILIDHMNANMSMNMNGMNMHGNLSDACMVMGSGVGHIDQDAVSLRAGSSVDFGGHNFGCEERVMIEHEGTPVGTAFTNSTGSFSTGSLSVPLATGNHTYTFTGQNSGIIGSATITVLP